MFTRNSLRTLLRIFTCLAALFLTVDIGNAQVTLLGGQVTLPRGVPLRPGWLVMNPNSVGPLILNPASSQEQRPGYAHTNIKIVIPPKGYPAIRPNTVGPPFSGYLAETPASLACVYQTGLGSIDAGKGCNPNLVTALPTGGVGAIAIVDAYDYPTAAADLAIFDSQFGVAAANFTVIYGTGSPSSGCINGTKPPGDGGNGWNIESSLDIEMAHAMAPSAHIYLVEANSNSFTDLYNAVQVAAKCVTAAGGGHVSMSWGANEFAGETSNDSYFTGTNVAYLASAGDSPGTAHPCVSPNVICVGGTTISRNGSTGFFLSESTWNSREGSVSPGGTGGGLSVYESRPAYQNFMSSIVGSHRGVPDLAAVADPYTGPWIYNSQAEWGGWGYVGGTSVAAPLLAGLFNRAGFIWTSSYNALTNLYGLAAGGTIAAYVTNINSGVCGSAHLAGIYPNAYNPTNDPANIQATNGIHWSTCAGLGTPKDSGTPNAGITTVPRGR
jgi:kumamolisin